MNYRLECWKHGFLGKTEAHPLRQIQALIRARAADAAAIERFLILCDIRTELSDDEVMGA